MTAASERTAAFASSIRVSDGVGLRPARGGGQATSPAFERAVRLVTPH